MSNSIETKIYNAAQSIEPSPEFSEELWDRINSMPDQSPAPSKNRRWVWIPASVVLTLALILFAVSSQEVMAAFRNLLSYIPGIGFVQEDESTLYLQEPVIVEQDGITLTLEQVVADADHTVVVYHIDGLKDNSCFYDGNKLLLPDGKSQLPIGGGVSGWEARIEYFPLPEGVTQATLLASRDEGTGSCTAPLEWQVDFSLDTTVPPELDLRPVIQNQELQPTAIKPAVTDPGNNGESASTDVQFIIDKVADLADGYVLQGHVEYENKYWMNVFIDMQNVYIQDADGKEIPLEQTDEGGHDDEFAFKIATKAFSSPITLHIQNLMIDALFENGPTFSFDAGSDPQIGQSWDINDEVELVGQEVGIYSVRVVEGSNQMDESNPNMGYAIEVDDSENIFWSSIICQGENQSMQRWSQGLPADNNHTIYEVYFDDEIPNGSVTCTFQHVHFQLPGSWQIEWSPPSAAE